jgi:hypothetical protein
VVRPLTTLWTACKPLMICSLAMVSFMTPLILSLALAKESSY